MTKNEIMTVLTAELQKVLPDLDAAQVTADARMADLGADSLDRSEVVQQTMRRLGVRLKPSELAGVGNLGDLADRLAQALQVA